MNVVVTRMDVWTAAGRGVDALVDAVVAGRRLATPTPGLPVPFAALTGAPDVDTLLGEVVRGVLPPGPGRVGLVVGTTSGAISGRFEAWMARGAPPDDEEAWRAAPARAVAARLGLAPVVTVSVACASSTVAFEIGAAWLRAGRCDRVIVAGVDLHSTYIHAGFAGLGALGPTGSRPFAADRDGLLLGEAAAAFLLEPEGGACAPPLAALLGAASSQDAHHLTAPHPHGAGLSRALRAALAEAGVAPGELDALSAHGTGTRLNDEAEARALTAVFAAPVPLHAIKGVVGHCLGAAGAVEAAVCIAALGGAALPPPPDTELLSVRAPGAVRTVASVNAAFGGVNAAVIFGAPGRRAPARPPASRGTSPRVVGRVHAHELPLAEVWPGAPAALGRADRYVRAGVKLVRELGPVAPDTLVVLHSAQDCRAADHRYYAGVLARGPAGASRLHFPYTVPGAPLAEASIAAALPNAAWVLCEGDAAALDVPTLRAGAGYPRVLLLRVDAPSDDPADAAVALATLYE